MVESNASADRSSSWSEFDAAKNRLAEIANECAVPQSDVIKLVAAGRVQDGRRRKWTNEQIASRLNVTANYLATVARNGLKTEEDLEKRMREELLHPLAQIQLAAGTKGATVPELMIRTGFSEKRTRALIREATETGHMEETPGQDRRRRLGTRYRSTGRAVVRPEPLAFADHHRRQLRVLHLLDNVRQGDLHELRFRAGKDDLERLRRDFTGENPQWALTNELTRLDHETTEVRHQELSVNFGAFVTVGPPHASRTDGILTAVHHATNAYVDPFCLIYPAFAGLDDEAANEFGAKSVPKIIRQLRTIVDHDAPRVPPGKIELVVTFGWARINSVTRPMALPSGTED